MEILFELIMLFCCIYHFCAYVIVDDKLMRGYIDSDCKWTSDFSRNLFCNDFRLFMSFFCLFWLLGFGRWSFLALLSTFFSYSVSVIFYKFIYPRYVRPFLLTKIESKENDN